MTNINQHSNLPHIDIQGHYQFITFRTKDSFDGVLKEIYGNNDSTKVKYYKMDRHLDQSKQGNLLYGDMIDEIQAYYLSYDKKLYDLYAVAIMPNHIHLLLRQKDSLANILRVLKGGSTHIVNKALERKGKVWAGDYFDKLIRDEAHFSLVYEYIKNNPIKAGLKDAHIRFYGSFE